MIGLLTRFIKGHWRLFAVAGVLFYLWGNAEINHKKLIATQEQLQQSQFNLKLAQQSNATLIAQLELEKAKLVEMQQFKSEEEARVVNDNKQIKRDLQEEECSRVTIPDSILSKLRNEQSHNSNSKD